MAIFDRSSASARFHHFGAVVTLGVVTALVVELVSIPAGAAAPPPTRRLTHTSLTGHSRVVSSTGLQLSVELAVTAEPRSSKESNDIVVVVRTPSGSERHAFDFTVAATPVHFAAGKGYVRAPNSRLHHFGHLDLAITATGHSRRTSCSTAPAVELTTPVTLLGRLYFATRSRGPKAWGSVGSTVHRVSLTGTLNRKYGTGSTTCRQATPPACVVATAWLTFHETMAVSFVAMGTTDPKSKLTVTREVNLGPNLTRSDYLMTPVPSPRFTGTTAHQRLAITTTGSPSATGTAVLAATGPALTESKPCRLRGTTQTERLRLWLAKIAPHDLAVHEQIYGVLTVPAGQGLFERGTYARR